MALVAVLAGGVVWAWISEASASGFMWVRDMPTVVLTALGRTGARASNRTIAFAGTRESEC